MLSNISHHVSEATDLNQTLQTIANLIKKEFNVDVCSIYLIDRKTKDLVLMATDGLLSESIGTVRLRFNKGIVGLVAERQKVINVANAPDHPRFHYFSETGEENYHGFLGVPIIHNEKLIGVLVLQQLKRSKFKDDIVSQVVNVSEEIASIIFQIK